MADPLMLTILGQFAERLVVIVGGILSLWFGYRLFSSFANSSANANPDVAPQRARLAAVAGFVLFGAWLVGSSARSPVSISRDDLLHAAKVRADDQMQRGTSGGLATLQALQTLDQRCREKTQQACTEATRLRAALTAALVQSQTTAGGEAAAPGSAAVGGGSGSNQTRR